MGEKGRRGPKPTKARPPTRGQRELAEIEELTARLEEGAPPVGSNPLKMKAVPPGYAGVHKFEDLPLSEYTRRGLRDSKFKELTAIQRAALPHSLCGRDILGAAKTGSGKTLSFLIPVLEKLFRAQWTNFDGLGALIISPTRELALQIFEELRKVGQYHDISAGLLIGGKDVKEEKSRINSMTILVCTPGRLLQHMDETPGFDCSSLQILVLDEADRCMDMGFSATMDAITSNLPPQRQTLLFSATQSKKVSDLARLSLKDPEFVSVHAEAVMSTPPKLRQGFIVCELQQKIDLLWFFIKTHLKKKTVIFVSTCKQVKFLFEAFRKLRPGVPLKMLHGHMKQMKRHHAFVEFCESSAMVLFATDIAARGLDFPSVDWVVQYDCPEDPKSYIHRVGRTARFKSAGEGLLMLLPSEETAMLALLEEAKVPIKRRSFDPKKLTPLAGALTSLLAKDDDLKQLAQGAFVMYLKATFLSPNKAVFDVSKLAAEDFAASMGLPTAPRIRLVKKLQKQAAKSQAKRAAKGGGGGVEDGGDEASDASEDASDGDASDSEDAVEALAAGHEAMDTDAVDAQAPAAPTPATSKRNRVAAAAASTAETAASTAEAQGEEAGSDSEGAGSQDQEDDDAGDEGDFLTIKRRHTADEEASGEDTPGPSPEALAASVPTVEQLEALSKKRKRKPLKINPDAASGNKTVFDDEGDACHPLEALVKSFADTGDDATAEERFERHKQRMKEQDVGDRLTEKQKRQEARLSKKLKARAALEAEAEENAGAAQATLGSPDSDSDSDGGGAARGGAARVRAYAGDKESSDEDGEGVGDVYDGPEVDLDEDEDEGRPKKAKAAYVGMGRRDDEVHELRTARKKQRLELDTLDLKAQEALALKLLS